MCGTSRALQIDCTALTEELWEGPKRAATPRASWSQAGGHRQGGVEREGREGGRERESCEFHRSFHDPSFYFHYYKFSSTLHLYVEKICLIQLPYSQDSKMLRDLNVGLISVGHHKANSVQSKMSGCCHTITFNQMGSTSLAWHGITQACPELLYKIFAK